MERSTEELKAKIKQTKRLSLLVTDPQTSKRLKDLLQELVQQLANNGRK